MTQTQFFSSFSEINWQATTKTSDLSEEAKKHLVKVYTSLVLTVFAGAVGAYLHTAFHIGGLMTQLAMIAALFYFHSLPPTNENVPTRFATLLGFGVLQGTSVGPLIEAVSFLDPSIPMTAFLGTTIVFAAFSMSALLAKRRSYLYLGGFLGSALSLLFWGGLLNMFFRSAMFFNLQLYGGLLVFSLFVIFDTQLIVEKNIAGDNDYAAHALHLFIDFVAIFIRILIILSRNSEKKKERR